MGGRGFAFSSPDEIRDEVRAFAEGARGMTYGRLDERGLQWPCPTEQHPGTPILHVDTFVSGPRAGLQPIDYHPTPEVGAPRYPLTRITAREVGGLGIDAAKALSRSEEPLNFYLRLNRRF